jgi:glycosyltransferase involved in cell wall biosynthesis
MILAQPRHRRPSNTLSSREHPKTGGHSSTKLSDNNSILIGKLRSKKGRSAAFFGVAQSHPLPGARWERPCIAVVNSPVDQLRVMLLNYEYPPLGGGAGIATRSLAESLTDLGVQVDVVTGGLQDSPAADGISAARGGSPAELRSSRLPRDVPGPNVFRVQTSRRELHSAGMAVAASYLLKAWPVVRRLLRDHRYDVIHCFFSLPTGALLPLARRAGVGTVLSLRGSDVPGYDMMEPRLQAVHRILRPLTRSIWSRADRVVALSTSLGDMVRQTQPDLQFKVIGNGVDLEHFRPRPGRRRAMDPLRCLAVSRLVQRKALDTLLYAFKRLPAEGFRLTIAGSGSEEATLRHLARSLDLDGTVRFAGPVPHAELANAYHEADVFVLLPRAESFGNVFAEAISSGLPVVGSAVGGVKDLVEEGVNGWLVPPDDPEAAAAAIARLADEGLRAEMGRQSRVRAESLLSWEGVASSYLSVYREVCGRPEPACRSVG